MNKTSFLDIPNSSGVYHFLDENGLVLYVGKAKNLKNRLRQYFLKELGRGPAIEQMVRLAADIKWIETESEIEAVLFEAELIKKLKPKYNIRLKDDKSFLVIKITKANQSSKIDSSVISSGEASREISEFYPTSPLARGRNDKVFIDHFPCVELVRFKDVDIEDKSADYFGPYPAGLLLKKSMRYLRKIFPYRDCSKTKFNNQKRIGRTCIYGDIRVCNGPCNAWVNEEEYAKNITYLKDFLRGKKKKVIHSLEKEMAKLSKEKHYEEAALIRNRLQALNHLKDVALGIRDDVFHADNILFKRIECYDISNIGDEFAVGSMVVFTNGKPDKDEYRKFRVKEDTCQISPPPTGSRNDNVEESDLSRLKQVLERRFRNDWPKPDLIIIDGGEMQLRVALEALKQSGLSIPALSISKGAKRKKNDFHFSDQNVAKYFGGNLVIQNIAISARDEAHRFAIKYYRTLHRRDLLGK